MGSNSISGGIDYSNKNSNIIRYCEMIIILVQVLHVQYDLGVNLFETVTACGEVCGGRERGGVVCVCVCVKVGEVGVLCRDNVSGLIVIKIQITNKMRKNKIILENLDCDETVIVWIPITMYLHVLIQNMKEVLFL